MKKFMIIAKVNGIDYLTKVEAETAAGAEHKILDLSYCGKHDYGVTACMAYDADAMKTDTFICNAIHAEPVSCEALIVIIDKRNRELERLDEAERRLAEIDKQMKALEEERNGLRDLIRK